MTHDKNKELIQIVEECTAACSHCFDACLKEEDVKMMADCIRLDVECSEICSLFSKGLARDTPFVKELAAACAAICEACGKECEKHDHDHCQKCAEACFKCAKACKDAA